MLLWLCTQDVRARQTLEFMVKCLCERFDVSEATLVDMIDALYENGMIWNNFF